MQKYEKTQGQRSNVTNFQPLSAFTMAHIRTKLHQFLISSFRDFVQTGKQTNAAKTTPACSMRTGNKNKYKT